MPECAAAKGFQTPRPGVTAEILMPARRSTTCLTWLAGIWFTVNATTQTGLHWTEPDSRTSAAD